MWKENLYQPVEILLRARYISDWRAPAFFFEMAYILEGTGSFVVNSVNGGEEHHNYCAADLCLIPPIEFTCFGLVHIAVICLSGSRRIM